MKKESRIALDRLAFSSLLAFLPCIIFSYLPVITLGMINGVHIDLSLLYIAMATVIVLHLPFLSRSLPALLRSLSWKFLAGFTTYLWLSTIWSPNSTRAVITAGFMTALLLISSIVALRLPELQKKKKLLLQLGLWAFIVSSVLALWQIIADVRGIPQVFTGLPLMYSGDVFGIARPTAFALEPQFFGSLLLIPLLWSAWHIFAKPSKVVHFIVLGGSTLLLLLTLSRGALLGAIIGCGFLAVLARPSLSSAARAALTAVVSATVSIGIIFAAGSVRPDTISGLDAIKRSINQLSLGVIDFKSPPPTTVKRPEVSQSSGYVPTSTDSRLSMSNTALNIWKSTPQTSLFGVGIGGFGASLTPSNPGKVVNNYYIELLVETGIVGILLFIAFISLLVWRLALLRQWLFLALIAALFTQMSFFSGNANIIHVWVIIGVAIGVTLLGKQVRRTLAS